MYINNSLETTSKANVQIPAAGLESKPNEKTVTLKKITKCIVKALRYYRR